MTREEAVGLIAEKKARIRELQKRQKLGRLAQVLLITAIVALSVWIWL